MMMAGDINDSKCDYGGASVIQWKMMTAFDWDDVNCYCNLFALILLLWMIIINWYKNDTCIYKVVLSIRIKV